MDIENKEVSGLGSNKLIMNCSQLNLQYGTFQENNRTLAIKLLNPII